MESSTGQQGGEAKRMASVWLDADGHSLTTKSSLATPIISVLPDEFMKDKLGL